MLVAAGPSLTPARPTCDNPSVRPHDLVLIQSLISLLAILPGATPARAEALPAKARGESYYHFSLGQQHRMAGEMDEAVAEYRRAIRADPRSASLHAELARLLREAGKNPEAVSAAESALAL